MSRPAHMRGSNQLKQETDARDDAMQKVTMVQLNRLPTDGIPSKADLEQAFRETIMANEDRNMENDIVEAFHWLLQKRKGIYWPLQSSDAAK